mmetsp:Transcript_8165/g.24579  ORF Transcript_8165/g.24579 Transcript_8165/m.24579 type:complete len:490 (-) Transcript_8165:160-1629(-)
MDLTDRRSRRSSRRRSLFSAVEAEAEAEKGQTIAEDGFRYRKRAKKNEETLPTGELKWKVVTPRTCVDKENSEPQQPQLNETAQPTDPTENVQRTEKDFAPAKLNPKHEPKAKPESRAGFKPAPTLKSTHVPEPRAALEPVPAPKPGLAPELELKSALKSTLAPEPESKPQPALEPELELQIASAEECAGPNLQEKDRKSVTVTDPVSKEADVGGANKSRVAGEGENPTCEVTKRDGDRDNEVDEASRKDRKDHRVAVSHQNRLDLSRSCLKAPTAGHSRFRKLLEDGAKKYAGKSEFKTLCQTLLDKVEEKLCRSCAETERPRVQDLLRTVAHRFLAGISEDIDAELQQERAVLSRYNRMRIEYDRLLALRASYQSELDAWDCVKKNVRADKLFKPVNAETPSEREQETAKHEDILGEKVKQLCETLELRSDGIMKAAKICRQRHEKQSQFWKSLTSELAHKAFDNCVDLGDPQMLVRKAVGMHTTGI